VVIHVGVASLRDATLGSFHLSPRSVPRGGYLTETRCRSRWEFFVSFSAQRPAARASARRSTGAGHRGAGHAVPGSRGRSHSSAANSSAANGSAANSRAANRVATVRAGRRGPFDDLPLTVLDLDNLPSFADLGLDKSLVQALGRAGIATPFPVQAATIPDALAGRDILGRAATGAGKTLAFGLPMIARLEGSKARPRRPRGLVLVPTRELAMQVTDSLAPLAQARDLSLRLVAGGLPISKQLQALIRGTDIVVATPGRLVDLIERRACDLSDVQVSVLDEADHMADLGFLPVVRQLLDQTPADGQRLLFSATLDGDVATLVSQYLTDPAIKALASPQAAVDTMDHHVFRVPAGYKWQLVTQIAARQGRTILFVRTKFGAERLADNLNRAGVAASALHGGRSQAQRTQALNGFKNGSVSALVATDVAARGIHVDDVSLVLHVDPPADSKDYLHRSGRTARAGESGLVVSIVTPNDERAVQALMSGAGVYPEQRSVLPGDPAMRGLTGAREPSGVPLAQPAPSRREAARSSGSDRSWHDRSPASGRERSSRGAARFETGRPDGRPAREAGRPRPNGSATFRRGGS
jgi:superfamily II DNA/RNA helicase